MVLPSFDCLEKKTDSFGTKNKREKQDFFRSRMIEIGGYAFFGLTHFRG